MLENGTTVYCFCTLGEEGRMYNLPPTTPEKIILDHGKVIITNTDRTKHVIKYNENVELFLRPIEKKDGTTGESKSDKGRTGKR